MKFEYPIAFEKERNGSFVVTCRDLPEVVSQGKDADDASLAAEGALQAAIEYRILEGLEIPKPTNAKRSERLVSLPPETAAKAALYLVMEEQGISKVELARQLRIHEKEVRRMLDPGHSTKIPRIAEVLRHLGRNLRVELV